MLKATDARYLTMRAEMYRLDYDKAQIVYLVTDKISDKIREAANRGYSFIFFTIKDAEIEREVRHLVEQAGFCVEVSSITPLSWLIKW